MLTGTLTPVSNKADWIEDYELTDEETGELIDISDVDEITVEIKDSPRDCVVQSATMTGGYVSLISAGIFEWNFPASQMGSLCAGTYDVRLRIVKDEIVTQLFIGYLPILDG